MSRTLLVFGNRAEYPELQDQQFEQVLRVRLDIEEESLSRKGEQIVGPLLSNWPQALELQKQLNQLSDNRDQPYTCCVKIEGFEPWWFHQEAIFHYVLLPYTRYRYLFETIRDSKRAIVVNAPDDFKQLAVKLLEGTGSTLVFKNSERGKDISSTFRKLRASLNRSLSGILFGALSLSCILGQIFRPSKVLIYTIDRTQPGKPFDSRIESIYRSLQEQKVTFVEILWRNVPGLSALRNAVRRRRLCIYMPQPRQSSNVDEFREFVPTTTDSWDNHVLHNIALHYLLPACRDSVCLVKTLMRILKRIAPEQMVLIDDFRHTHELVVACKLLDIKTQGFQHGQFNRYSVGLMAYGFRGRSPHTFDKYHVWSPFFKDLLVNSSDLYRNPELLQVTGFPRPVSFPSDHEERRKTGEIRVLFLWESYERSILAQEVTPFLQILHREPRFRLLLKLKPGGSPEEISWLDPSLISSIDVRSGPIDDALNDADVVVGSYSSALFDAVRYLKPVVIFDTSVWQDLHGLADDGIAQRATSPGEIVQKIFEILETPKNVLSSFRSHVWGKRLKSSGASYDFRLPG